jgi:hypothetical protein
MQLLFLVMDEYCFGLPCKMTDIAEGLVLETFHRLPFCLVFESFDGCTSSSSCLVIPIPTHLISNLKAIQLRKGPMVERKTWEQLAGSTKPYHSIYYLTEFMNGFTSYVPCRLVACRPQHTEKNILPEKTFSVSTLRFCFVVCLLPCHRRASKFQFFNMAVD